MGDVGGIATSNVTLYNEEGLPVSVTPAGHLLVDIDSFRVALTTESGLAQAAQPEGGRNAFDASTGLLSIGSSGEQPFCLFVNPASSARDLVLFNFGYTASGITVMNTYRNPATSGLGTAQTVINRGGGTNTSVGKLYVPGQYTVTGGIRAKVNHLAANTPNPDNPEGSMILRPGDALSWTLAGPGGSGGSISCAMNIVWIDQPAAT